MTQFLRHNTGRRLLTLGLQAILYALLLAMLSYRFAPIILLIIGALGLIDIASNLRRPVRALLRARRFPRGKPRPQPAPSHARALTYYGSQITLSLFLLDLSLAWRLIYLGMPFLPLAPPAPWALAWGAGIGLGGALLILAIAFVERRQPGSSAPIAATGRQAATVLRGDALTFVLLPAAAEELFLRGALQPTIGWPLTALLAGAAYLLALWRRGRPGWGIVAAIASAGLGWVFDLSGDLWAVLLGHVLIAGAVLAALRYGRRLIR